MRWLVVVAIVAACQDGVTLVRDVPRVLADVHGPDMRYPPCTIAAAQCRRDRVVDLDGDGVLDCVRARGTVVHVWPACSGDAITFASEGTLQPFSVPEALRTPRWLQAIAHLLADHVSCETPARDCAAPSPIARVALSFTRTTRAPFEPPAEVDLAWQGGAPALSPREVAILDPAIARAKPQDDGDIDFAFVQLLVIDPAEVGTWRRSAQFGPPPDDSSWRSRCEHYELSREGGVVFATNLATRQWAPIFVGADGVTDELACGGDLALVETGWPIDATGVIAINLATSAVRTFGTSMQSPANMARVGWIRTTLGPRSLAQLRATIRALPSPLPACSDREPGLVELDPPGACVLEGRDDTDGDGTIDCWRATYDGARGVPVGWSVETWSGCDRTHAGVWRWFDVAGGLRYINPGLSDPPALTAWIARRVGGASLRCMPARAGCAAVDPLFALAIAHTTNAPVRLQWQPGTPALPPLQAGLVPDVYGDRGMLAIFGAREPMAAGELQPAAECGALQYWRSPTTVAVLDRTKHAWAWLYTEAPTLSWSEPIGRLVCDGALAAFDVGHGFGVVVDASTGSYASLQHGIPGGPDRAAQLRAALATNE